MSNFPKSEVRRAVLSLTRVVFLVALSMGAYSASAQGFPDLWPATPGTAVAATSVAQARCSGDSLSGAREGFTVFDACSRLTTEAIDPSGTHRVVALATDPWLLGSGGAIYYSGGNVGIGTSTPPYPLTVVNAGAVSALFTGTSSDPAIRVSSALASHPYIDLVLSNTTTPNAAYGEIRVGDDSNWRNLILLKSGVGSVGIGTPLPQAPLHVQGVALTDGPSRRSILALDSSPAALGTGGGISFGGLYSASGNWTVDFANVWGIKENATDNDNAGALLFATHTNGATPAERMRIGSNGLVTIGPSGGSGTLLTVNGDLNAAGGHFSSLVQSVSGGFKFPDGTVQTTAAAGTQWSSGGAGVISYSGGAVGIGTSSPAAGNLFDVAGAAHFNGVVQSATGGFKFPDGTVQTTAASGSGSSQWATGTPSGAIYYNGGNVGIRSTTANNTLEVGSAALGTLTGTAVAVSNTSGNSVMSVGQSPTARGRIGWSFNATESSAFMFLGSISGLPLDLQDGGGSVGIGTATPAASLHVKGAATVNGAARRNIVAFDSSASGLGVGGGISFGGNYSSVNSTVDFGNIWGIKENATDNDNAGALLFATHANGAAPVERMRIGSDGLVTLGTTGATTTQLAVNGVVQSVSGGFKFPDGTLQTTAATGDSGSSQWSAGQQTSSIYYSAGNVGIGTSSAPYPLSVSNTGGVSALFTGTASDPAIRIASTSGSHPYLDLMVSNSASPGAAYGEISVGDASNWRNLILVKSGAASVGIGTALPQAPLHVQGVALADGTSRRSIAAIDSSPAALGTGGGISFGGYTSAIGNYTVDFGTVWGIKENATDNDSAGALLFATHANGVAPAERMRIGSNGLVSIGPSGGSGTLLTVNGDINVTGNINAKYQDLAEWVPSGQRLQPGTVVTIKSGGMNEVLPSSRAYDTSVAGVVSEKPGVILGVEGDAKSRIATTGRVRVHVDATGHPIAAGDLLVTSDKSGMAMYSEPVDLGGVKIHRPGTIIGKALEPLSGGEGEILVLLSMQ